MSLQLLKPGAHKPGLLRPNTPKPGFLGLGWLRSHLLAASMRKDQLRVFMHPDQLLFIRIKRSGNQQLIHKKMVACTALAQDIDPAMPAWSGAINALREELRDDSWHGAKLQLVLSNHFVHYAVIPWHASLSNRLERQAFLRHSFSLAYGDAARLWDVRMSDSGVSRPALASGIEQGLLRELEHAVKDANIQLGAIYPHLMVAINQARPQTGAYASYWFAVLEAGRWCVALIQDGNWHAVKTFAVADTEPASDTSAQQMRAQLTAYLARESVLCGIASPELPVVLYRPGHSPCFAALDDGRAVLWINTAPINILSTKTPNSRTQTSAVYATPGSSSASGSQSGQHCSDYETVLWT